jgi:hypothetical protein
VLDARLLAKALECQREFGEMFRKAVVLFMLKERGVFDPIGSGTFVFHEGKLLIVSAAHVFEDLANKGQVYLHIGPINQIVKLNRINIFTSSKEDVGGSRAKDALDLGVMVVPDEIIDICNGKILMIEEDLIENHTNTKSVQFYQAIGYPGVKNTKLAQKASRKNQLFTPEILIYSGAHKSAEEVSNEKFVDEYHVILDWNNKKNYDDDGNRVNVPKPNGISGGLIQGCFYYIPKSNGFYPTCAAGIITEKDTSGSAMIGTRFKTVFEWLRLHPEMLE